MARDVQMLDSEAGKVVICIDDFLKKIREHALRLTEVAARRDQIGPEPEDDDPDDDPPSAVRMAA
jgi:hypothetical protein